MFHYIILCTALFAAPLFAAITSSMRALNPQQQKVTIHFDIPEKDFIYKEYLSLSADHPAVTISGIHIAQTPQSMYAASFKKTKDVFKEPFDLTFDLSTSDANLTKANVVLDYYQESNKKIMQHVLPITFDRAPKSTVTSATQTPQTIPDLSKQMPLVCPSTSTDHAEQPSFCNRLSTILTTTESVWLQLLLAFLLGLILSLTPCIYPMIPVTIGILQAQGSSSVWRNLSLATAYTCGIATTFAILGLLSAFTGQLFGSLMNSPVVILFIVAVLAYLAGAMIGWYPMYTPSLMQNNTGTQRGGSLLAAFSFGAASGTVASPCLSPGLILLLSIVTKLGSVLLGFALLFAFGVGLSVPLLIIGTFSSSLTMLPRAGMWMVEIKKIFGYMMFGMCLYFLQGILSCVAFTWLTTVVAAVIGILYLKESAHKSGIWYLIYSLLGMGLLVASVWSGFGAYRQMVQPKEQDSLWIDTYDNALVRARAENKHILVDVGTPCCTICKAIDKKFFTHETIRNVLQKLYVAVKINGADDTNQRHMDLQKQYAIIGAPTLLIIDPETGNEIKRWGSELYDATIDEFARELKSLA